MKTFKRFNPSAVLSFRHINVYSADSSNLEQIETLSKITKKMKFKFYSEEDFNEIKEKEADSQSATELLVIDGLSRFSLIAKLFDIFKNMKKLDFDVCFRDNETT